MLTRCKKGMIVVTSRNLLERTPARDTLVGQLATHWQRRNGAERTWTDWRLVTQRRAHLPGAVATSRPFTGVPLSVNFPDAAAPTLVRSIHARSMPQHEQIVIPLTSDLHFPPLSQYSSSTTKKHKCWRNAPESISIVTSSRANTENSEVSRKPPTRKPPSFIASMDYNLDVPMLPQVPVWVAPRAVSTAPGNRKLPPSPAAMNHDLDTPLPLPRIPLIDPIWIEPHTPGNNKSKRRACVWSYGILLPRRAR